jgi:hypothetical protein
MMHLIEFSGPDDYIVIFEGEEGHSFEIGHIFRSVYGPEDRPWLWCIQFRHRASRSPPHVGYVADFEEAKTALAGCWHYACDVPSDWLPLEHPEPSEHLTMEPWHPDSASVPLASAWPPGAATFHHPTIAANANG